MIVESSNCLENSQWRSSVASEVIDKLGTGFLNHFVRKPRQQAILHILSIHVHSIGSKTCAQLLRTASVFLFERSFHVPSASRKAI